MQDRLAEYQDATRLHTTAGVAIFKCAVVADLAPDADHEGHEIHIIHYFPGSPFITAVPPCIKCGEPMRHMSGAHPATEPFVNLDAQETGTETC